MKKFSDYLTPKTPEVPKKELSITEQAWAKAKQKNYSLSEKEILEQFPEMQETEEVLPELAPIVEEIIPEPQIVVEQIQGPQGERGEKGDKGDKGDTGEQGPQGEKGERGFDGARGPEGQQGIQGPKGDKGDAGLDGKDGAQGIKGDTGEIGPKGDRGDKGEQGEVGPQGIQGPKGDKGDKGDVGPTGEKGADGAKGAKGDKGARGDKGDKGDVGEQGPKGDKGDQGPIGPQGPKGADGKSPDIKKFADKFEKLSQDINKRIDKTVQGMNLTGGGGSGSYWLNDLGDTDYDTIKNATDGQVLTYDDASGKWIASDITVTGAVGTLQQVTTAGNTTTLGITTAAVQLNLASAVTVTQGQMAWNPADLTVDVGMANGVTLQLGQEQYIKVKASADITDGQAVMFTGVNGEHILAAPNDMTVPGYRPEYFIGVATQSISLNGFGYITVFGKVHDINTLAWTAGDILYANPAVVGGLTNTEPEAPNFNIMVAAVTKRAGGDGHIMVRPTFRSSLSQLNDIAITSIGNNNLLKYVSANSRWENVTSASVIEPAFSKANSATTLAQAAYDYANTIVSDTQVDPYARAKANGAYDKANSATTLAQAAYDYANTITGSSSDTIARNQANNAFTQANLAFDAANTAVTSGQANVGAGLITVTTAYQANVGAGIITEVAARQANVGASVITLTNNISNAFNQANLAFNKSNSATLLAQSAYDYANTIISDTQIDQYARNTANTNANNITIVGTYANNAVTSGQANVGAGLITVTNNYQANVGQLRLDTVNANTSLAANIGAARITDTASGQANVGAGLITITSAYQANVGSGLITVTNNYQANVGQLRLDTVNANTSLAANIGAARIADLATNQANVGAGLITITGAYQANVGAARIGDKALWEANTGAGLIAYQTTSQANVGSAIAQGQANVGAGLITVTSAYQANVGAGLITKLNTTGGSLTGQLNVSFTPASTINTAMTITAANTKGGTGYADVFQLTNSSGGATNGTKWIRINQTGGLEIINSAYSAMPFHLSDSGDLTISGNLIMSGIQSGYSANRPGFRVIGGGTTNIDATSVSQTLTSSNWAVDWSQGSYLNGTTGVFTAPLNGLYSVNLTARTQLNNYAGISAIAVVKTSGGTSTNICYVEWYNNTTTNHMGSSTVIKLTAGDTLKLVATTGKVTFDLNDNWAVAFLG